MKTLKTLTLIAIAVVTLTAFSNKAMAQAEETGTVNLKAKLNTSITLNLTTGSDIVFEFNTYSDYLNGVGLQNDLKTEGTVEATCDWTMSCKANGNFLHTNGSSEIPVSQVGLKVASTGTLSGNTEALVTSYTALNTTGINLLAPDGSATTNAGTSAQNKFEITWQMGAGTGPSSLLVANYLKGEYNTSVTLTLQETFGLASNPPVASN